MTTLFALNIFFILLFFCEFPFARRRDVKDTFVAGVKPTKIW